MVSGTKWDLGVGRESCEPALGLRLRGPEECVAWVGLSSSAFVLWSAWLGTGPSFLEADGAGSGLLSCWDGSLAVKIRQKFIRSNIWRPQPNADLHSSVLSWCFRLTCRSRCSAGCEHRPTMRKRSATTGGTLNLSSLVKLFQMKTSKTFPFMPEPLPSATSHQNLKISAIESSGKITSACLCVEIRRRR